MWVLAEGMGRQFGSFQEKDGMKGDENAVELYRKYRPTLWKHFVGQEGAVRTLDAMVKAGNLPHALLLTGPSGAGKTSAARVLMSKLDCHEDDFKELNCADARGIDTIRDIKNHMGLAALYGKCRIYCLDEAHRATPDGQSMLLKMLEDTPRHVYFFLATTDPQKLLKTIITRCTEVKFAALSKASLEKLVGNVLTKEGEKLSDDVMEHLVDVADGSGRKALVLLHQILGLDSDEEKIAAVEKADAQRQAKELCQMLLRGAKWGELAKLVRDLDEDPENLRRAVLGYASAVLLNGKASNRAYLILTVFSDSFFYTGKPGLVKACYEVSISKD